MFVLPPKSSPFFFFNVTQISQTIVVEEGLSVSFVTSLKGNS